MANSVHKESLMVVALFARDTYNADAKPGKQVQLGEPAYIRPEKTAKKRLILP